MLLNIIQGGVGGIRMKLEAFGEYLEALNARWVCDALGMLNRKDTRVLDLQMCSGALTLPNSEGSSFEPLGNGRLMAYMAHF